MNKGTIIKVEFDGMREIIYLGKKLDWYSESAVTKIEETEDEKFAVYVGDQLALVADRGNCTVHYKLDNEPEIQF